MGINLNFSKQGIGFSAKFFDFELSFNAKQYIFGVAHTLGVKNIAGKGRNERVLFLDYDDILFEDMLLPELAYLQDKYKLSDFYIFKSSQGRGNFHAVCLDKLKVGFWQTILEDSSCDEAYKHPRIKDFNCSVLRIVPKGHSNSPKFIFALHSPYNEREKSLAHAKYLEYHQGVNITKVINLDRNTKLFYVDYKTLNYLKRGV